MCGLESTRDTDRLHVIQFITRNYLMPTWLVQLVLFGSRHVRFPGLAHSFTSCQLLVKGCVLVSSIG